MFEKLTDAGRVENLSDLPDPDCCVLARGDLARADDVRSVLARHALVRIVNRAAETHVDCSIDGPRACVETILLGTLELLEATRGHLEPLSE